MYGATTLEAAIQRARYAFMDHWSVLQDDWSSHAASKRIFVAFGKGVKKEPVAAKRPVVRSTQI